MTKPSSRPSRVRTLRPLLLLPPVLIAAALLVLALRGREAPERIDPAEMATTARVLTIAPTPFMPRVSGFGVVEPARRWSATAQVAGRIAALSSDLIRGGRIAAGAELLRIEDVDYRIALARAESALAGIDARLSELDLNGDNARASLGIERETLELTQSETTRQRDLVARGAAPQVSLEAQERKLLAQRARIQDLENRLALLPDQRRALEAEQAAAQAGVERARLDLERATLRAPFDAQIVSVEVEQDQFVGVGARLAALQGVAQAEIEVQLPQARMRDLARATASASAAALDPAILSARVTLRLEDEVASWPARVSRPAASVATTSRAFSAILTVDNPLEGDAASGRPPLFPGLFVEAEIVAPTIDAAVVAPRSAIHDGAVLLADAQDRLRRQPVEVAMEAEDAALIASGLSPGDRVVLTDLPAAVEGMLLRPVEDDAAAARLRRAATP